MIEEFKNILNEPNSTQPYGGRVVGCQADCVDFAVCEDVTVCVYDGTDCTYDIGGCGMDGDLCSNDNCAEATFCPSDFVLCDWEIEVCEDDVIAADDIQLVQLVFRYGRTTPAPGVLVKLGTANSYTGPYKKAGITDSQGKVVLECSSINRDSSIEYFDGDGVSTVVNNIWSLSQDSNNYIIVTINTTQYTFTRPFNDNRFVVFDDLNSIVDDGPFNVIGISDLATDHLTEVNLLDGLDGEHNQYDHYALVNAHNFYNCYNQWFQEIIVSVQEFDGYHYIVRNNVANRFTQAISVKSNVANTTINLNGVTHNYGTSYQTTTLEPSICGNRCLWFADCSKTGYDDVHKYEISTIDDDRLGKLTTWNITMVQSYVPPTPTQYTHMFSYSGPVYDYNNVELTVSNSDFKWYDGNRTTQNANYLLGTGKTYSVTTSATSKTVTLFITHTGYQASRATVTTTINGSAVNAAQTINGLHLIPTTSYAARYQAVFMYDNGTAWRPDGKLWYKWECLGEHASVQQSWINTDGNNERYDIPEHFASKVERVKLTVWLTNAYGQQISTKPSIETSTSTSTALRSITLYPSNGSEDYY